MGECEPIPHNKLQTNAMFGSYLDIKTQRVVQQCGLHSESI